MERDDNLLGRRSIKVWVSKELKNQVLDTLYYIPKELKKNILYSKKKLFKS